MKNEIVAFFVGFGFGVFLSITVYIGKLIHDYGKRTESVRDELKNATDRVGTIKDRLNNATDRVGESISIIQKVRERKDNNSD